MIDTVFFLLVFFMIASLSMAVYNGVPVNLPQAATGQGAAPGASVTVTRGSPTSIANRWPRPRWASGSRGWSASVTSRS